MDIYTLIKTKLERLAIISLVARQAEPCNKAGVIPFTRDAEGFRYYLMKPRGTQPELGEPPYQLCKGTRQYYTEGEGWRDIRERDDTSGAQKETMAQTALREGIEELGLVLDNITALFDLGLYDFSSATTGKQKQMWLFAASVANIDAFLPDREIAETTAARAWLTAAEFAVVGREDHRYIVQDIEKKLTSHL